MLQMDRIRLFVFVCILLQIGGANSNSCWYVPFVSRSSWRAASPRSTTRLNTNLDYYIIHHTDTGKCSTQSSCSERVRSIQRHHMNTRDWDDIGYNFLIGGDNKVYVGRGWDNQGAHAYGYNDRSIGIAIIGNYDREEPDLNVQRTLNKLIRCGVNMGKVSRNYEACGHRDFSSTVCPGKALYDLVNSWGRCDVFVGPLQPIWGG